MRQYPRFLGLGLPPRPDEATFDQSGVPVTEVRAALRAVPKRAARLPLPAGRLLADGLSALVARHPGLDLVTRGVGLLHGVQFKDPAVARAVARAAFSNGLVIELCGARSNVLKCMPPLIISDAELLEGVGLIERSLQDVSRGELRGDPGPPG